MLMFEIIQLRAPPPIFFIMCRQHISPRGTKQRLHYCRGTAFPRRMCKSNLMLVSHLGARELEHDDLASLVTRDEDLVAVHTNCQDITLQIDVNSLQDVA